MEKWIESLRNRFTDRRVAPPDGLWKDIQASLVERNIIECRSDSRKRVSFPVLLRRAVAVAACLAGVVWVGYLLIHNDNYDSYVADDSGKHYKSVGGSTLPSGVLRVKTVDSENNTVADYSRIVGESNAKQEILEQDNTAQFTGEDVIASRDTITNESETANDDNTESVVVKRRSSHDNQYGNANKRHEGKLFAASAKKNGGGVGQVSLSVYGSGMASLGSSSGASGVALMASNQYQGSIGSNIVNDEVMLLSTTYVDDDEPSEIKIRHRQPLKVGMAVRFDLGGRWGLDTGMNYSYHFSTMSSDDEFNGYHTEQKLHFVGLPLAVSYNVWGRKNLEVYLSAGGAVEFCVSGKSSTTRSMSDDNTQSYDQDLRDRRPQWSVNASAGLQYKINDILGVYLEPGVGYYFDNGSNVSTIYKEKPLNFNFTVGLRFMVR